VYVLSQQQVPGLQYLWYATLDMAAAPPAIVLTLAVGANMQLAYTSNGPYAIGPVPGQLLYYDAATRVVALLNTTVTNLFPSQTATFTAQPTATATASVTVGGASPSLQPSATTTATAAGTLSPTALPSGAQQQQQQQQIAIINTWTDEQRAVVGLAAGLAVAATVAAAVAVAYVRAGRARSSGRAFVRDDGGGRKGSGGKTEVEMAPVSVTRNPLVAAGVTAVSPSVVAGAGAGQPPASSMA
jgi:hypothetical protein